MQHEKMKTISTYGWSLGLQRVPRQHNHPSYTSHYPQAGPVTCESQPTPCGQMPSPSVTFPSANTNLFLPPPLKPLQTQQRQASAPPRERASPQTSEDFQRAGPQEGPVARARPRGHGPTSVRCASASLRAAQAVLCPQTSPRCVLQRRRL